MKKKHIWQVEENDEEFVIWALTFDVKIERDVISYRNTCFFLFF